MAGKDEIESFLKDMKTKLSVFDIAFRPRHKNTQALADLEIQAKTRLEAISSLTFEDYCSGPTQDTDEPGSPDYYVFGKQVNGREVYIKLSLGRPGKMVDCISFHPSEYPLTYPFAT